MKKRADLTDLQLDVMRVLWRRGEANATTVWEALRARRRLATTTVATLLKRLEKKGVVTHRVEGRTHIYRARLAEEDMRRGLLGRVSAAFSGDVAALLAQLLDEHDVNAEDLARVRALIAAKERELEERS
jgi:predicted transcriptional regulator